jgi:hypothetical protein
MAVFYEERPFWTMAFWIVVSMVGLVFERSFSLAHITEAQ